MSLFCQSFIRAMNRNVARIVILTRMLEPQVYNSKQLLRKDPFSFVFLQSGVPLIRTLLVVKYTSFDNPK